MQAFSWHKNPVVRRTDFQKYCLAPGTNYTPCPGAFLARDPVKLDTPTGVVNYALGVVQDWDYRAPGRQPLLRSE